jgi:hypothetical protein
MKRIPEKTPNSARSSVCYSPPPELCAKREHKHLLPLHEVRTVVINVGGIEHHPDGTLRGGTHASPRLHWRHGHIRRLPSGDITNVRPCLVGSAELGTIDHDFYKVDK